MESRDSSVRGFAFRSVVRPLGVARPSDLERRNGGGRGRGMTAERQRHSPFRPSPVLRRRGRLLAGALCMYCAEYQAKTNVGTYLSTRKSRRKSRSTNQPSAVSFSRRSGKDHPRVDWLRGPIVGLVVFAPALNIPCSNWIHEHATPPSLLTLLPAAGRRRRAKVRTFPLQDSLKRLRMRPAGTLCFFFRAYRHSITQMPEKA